MPVTLQLLNVLLNILLLCKSHKNVVSVAQVICCGGDGKVSKLKNLQLRQHKKLMEPEQMPGEP